MDKSSNPTSIPEIPPKPGELKTELLGLKASSSEVPTSQQ
nr:PREDICTED: uncharacterized protein C12orf73 homolog [Opisthocomus hoazin]